MVEAKIAGRMAVNVIDNVPSVQANEKGTSAVSHETIKGNIEFKNVVFNYPTRKDFDVLKDFCCTFEAGKTTALVGFSGSGKSTVVQLIERFYDPASGTVLVDGVDMKTLNLQQLRRSIGYVG